MENDKIDHGPSDYVVRRLLMGEPKSEIDCSHKDDKDTIRSILANRRILEFAKHDLITRLEIHKIQ
jgi:hypothetical protein